MRSDLIPVAVRSGARWQKDGDPGEQASRLYCINAGTISRPFD
ncbi:hypothetical protein [Xanthomonas prunicola]|nr:hypothetical protein [Xanthomonas prunicola]